MLSNESLGYSLFSLIIETQLGLEIKTEGTVKVEQSQLENPEARDIFDIKFQELSNSINYDIKSVDLELLNCKQDVTEIPVKSDFNPTKLEVGELTIKNENDDEFDNQM